ncbi:hypothetical protein, partial [Sodaliphilus sp.]|uniref:hypothetical protein n=1 Tax=Sodaliphilus sp. TaxID=2815818 RepID=UPI00388F2FC8
ACLVSCGSRADRPSLVAIDSLILQAPDSACELLADYPEDSLTTADDRAYHALLTTIADYKAYRPATSDSIINIALNHYDRNGANPDHRMRSLLYKGCVMEELGDAEQAIEYYKRAETLCPADDYFHIGYINFRKASLYNYELVDSLPVILYKTALHGFKKAGDKHYEAQTLGLLGSVYTLLNNDSAEYYIKHSVIISKEINDSSNIYDGLASLCALYFHQEKYKEVTSIAHETLVTYGKYTNNRMCNDFVSTSFAKMNLIDSAYWYLNLALPANNIEDSISMFRAKAEIALAERDTYKYIELNQIAVDLADSVLVANQAIDLREAELKYEKAETKIDYLAKQRRYLLFMAILVVVILSITYIVVLLRQKLRFARQEVNDAIIQLNNMKRHIEQQTVENKNFILRIQEQEAQLKEIQCTPASPDNSLQALSELIIIQEKTKFCIDEILHCVFYNGKHKSDNIIGNDAPIIVSDEFWNTLDEIIAIKHRDIKERLDNKNLSLSSIEKRVFGLCTINMPNAIIRRILNYKNVQIVSNYRHKLAVKILGEGHKLEEII